MNACEPISLLRSVWQETPDALKKEFTRYVAEQSHAEFVIWSKGIRGFRPDSLVKRSSEHVCRLMDDRLFRLWDGRFAVVVLSNYLTDTQADLNRAFVARFVERAAADRQVAAETIRKAVLQDLASAGHDAAVLSLYAATLVCVEPRYAAETPPEDTLLSTIADWVAP